MDALENFILNEEGFFLLLLKQIHEDLDFLHKYFRNEKQFKHPPIDFKSENILFLKILIMLLFVILLCQLKFNNINIVLINNNNQKMDLRFHFLKHI